MFVIRKVRKRWMGDQPTGGRAFQGFSNKTTRNKRPAPIFKYPHETWSETSGRGYVHFTNAMAARHRICRWFMEVKGWSEHEAYNRIKIMPL